MSQHIAFGQLEENLGPWQPPPKAYFAFDAEGSGCAGQTPALRAIPDQPVFALAAFIEKAGKSPEAQFEAL
jgi:hypothetical protein